MLLLFSKEDGYVDWLLDVVRRDVELDVGMGEHGH